MADDSEMRRVTFELPKRDVPELMAALGHFVASTSSIIIEFGDGPAVTEPPSIIEAAEATRPSYDPRLALLVLDADSGQEVPVITHSLLRAFAQATLGDTENGERLGNGLFKRLNEKRLLHPFVLMSPEGDRAIGLKVEHAMNALEQLKSGVIKLRNVGPASIRLLETYCDALFPELQPEPKPKI